MIKSSQLEMLFNALRTGMNLTDSCDLAGIGRTCFYSRLKKDKKFAHQVEMAELDCKRRNIMIIQKAANKSWQAAAWHLERKYPKEYSRRQEITGAEGDPLIPVAIDKADASL